MKQLELFIWKKRKKMRKKCTQEYCLEICLWERVDFRKSLGLSGMVYSYIKGGNIDSIARQFLWHVGEDY